MVDFKRFVVLIAFGCCCWNKLLTAKTTCWIAWDTLSCMMIIFSFYKFFVVMDGISANDSIQASTFSEGYNENPAKGFLQLWFACNTCQCFVRISFKFGNARLYFTDNGTYRSSRRFCWCSSCFRQNILIEFDVLGCRESFSLKSMDVPISHWESFDGHLIFGKSSL